MWTMTGMIDWLIGKDPVAADLRRRCIFHVTIMQNPDGPVYGYTRGNAQGYDTNRNYLRWGSNKEKQSHEGYICQKDLEDIMKSDAPATTVWSMHGGGGGFGIQGPEMGTILGPPEDFAKIMKGHDPVIYDAIGRSIVPVGKVGGSDSTWNGGPGRQFRVSSFLYEHSVGTKDGEFKIGVDLLKSIGEYWKGTKQSKRDASTKPKE